MPPVLVHIDAMFERIEKILILEFPDRHSLREGCDLTLQNCFFTHILSQFLVDEPHLWRNFKEPQNKTKINKHHKCVIFHPTSKRWGKFKCTLSVFDVTHAYRLVCRDNR